MMLYNKQRVLINNYVVGEPSTCPDCGGQLVAKRGKLISWHWAHKTNTSGCSCGETEWHLLCKSTLLGCDGWDVEVPVTSIDSGSGEPVNWRLDAYHEKTGVAVEFVNSNNFSYLFKHNALLRHELSRNVAKVFWVFNALGSETLSAAKWRFCSGDGIRHLLKPAAADTVDQIDQLSTLVAGPNVKSDCYAVAYCQYAFIAEGHIPDSVVLLRHWRNNVWFPTGNRIAAELLPLVKPMTAYSKTFFFGVED